MKEISAINEDKFKKALKRNYFYVENEAFHQEKKDFLEVTLPSNFNEVPYFVGQKRIITNLTKEQELAAFLQYNYYKYMAKKTLEKLSTFSIEEANNLIYYFDKVQDVFNIIVCLNLGLVYSMISNTKFASMDEDERLSEANKGLLTAVEKFDVKTGNKFSTYAFYSTYNAVLKKTLNNHKVNEAIEYSLDDDINVNGESCKREPISKEENPNIAMIDTIRKSIDENIFGFSDFEIKVLKIRYLGDKKVSVSKTAEELGVDSGTINRVEKRIFPKMKQKLLSKYANIF